MDPKGSGAKQFQCTAAEELRVLVFDNSFSLNTAKAVVHA